MFQKRPPIQSYRVIRWKDRIGQGSHFSWFSFFQLTCLKMIDETWHLDVVIIRCFTHSFQNKKRPPNRLTKRTRMKQQKQRKAQHHNFKTRKCQFKFTERIKLLCKPFSFDLNNRTGLILVHNIRPVGQMWPAEAIYMARIAQNCISLLAWKNTLWMGKNIDFDRNFFGPLEIWVVHPWCKVWILGKNECKQNDLDAMRIAIHEPYYRGSDLALV